MSTKRLSENAILSMYLGERRIALRWHLRIEAFAYSVAVGQGADVGGEGAIAIGRSANAPAAAVRSRSRRIFGVQFHTEVVHTVPGTKILKNYLT